MPDDPRTARVIASGLGFTEGPVLMQDGSVVVTSLTHGRLYRVTKAGTEVLCEMEAAANGAAEGSDGAVYIAHFWGWPPAKESIGSTGGVLRTTASGGVEWLTRDPVAPNDLCFGPDGLLYVTDPTRPRRSDGRIWRCDIESGVAELLVSLHWHPNGIAFDASSERLFVTSSHAGEILFFPFASGEPLGDPVVWATLPSGRPDGIAFDLEGNLIVAAPVPEGEKQSFLHVFDPDGNHVEEYVPVPSVKFTNVALGADRTLIVTDAGNGSVLAVDNWPTAGLPLHPFR